VWSISNVAILNIEASAETVLRLRVLTEACRGLVNTAGILYPIGVVIVERGWEGGGSADPQRK